MAKKFANTNPAFGLAAASIDLDRVTNPDFPEINKVPLADIHPNPNQPRASRLYAWIGMRTVSSCRTR